MSFLRFNRLTAITDVNYDNDLDDDYFLIFARRLEGAYNNKYYNNNYQ